MECGFLRLVLLESLQYYPIAIQGDLLAVSKWLEASERLRYVCALLLLLQVYSAPIHCDDFAHTSLRLLSRIGLTAAITSTGQCL
jgi:hypothetical protein